MAEKKRQMSPEAREKLSQLAKQRHAEGKFGGAEFGKMGGRPRKDRAAQSVAEAAQEEANRRKIIQVFKDAVDGDQHISTRLKGAEAWLQIEREEGKLSIQEEEQDAKQHSREELIEILAKRLTSGPAAEQVRRKLEEQIIVDADVVPDE